MTDATKAGWKQRLDIRRLLKSKGGDVNVNRLRRRNTIIKTITQRLPVLRVLLFALGYAWMLIIPHFMLGKRIYIDENALQPGQTMTHWSWADVHNADVYLEQLESLRDANATSEQRADYLVTEFKKMGIASDSQAYAFDTNTGVIKGANAYAVLSSPRQAGAEAMVISASWRSRIDEGQGALNLRGVSTVLALANFVKKYSMWSKDIIFVVSDGYMDGMQAWLTSYHDLAQDNMVADRITLPSGVIWTALNVDYPGHSFSHFGIFHEGLNGRLPNQDLINSFTRIAGKIGGVPVTLYDYLNPRDSKPPRPELEILPSWVPDTIRHHPDVASYIYQARNVLRHVDFQARGKGSGVHGLFHQFRIDAFTIFAIPAVGPHGFHSIGKVLESTMRTKNNILERLHASFFFYIFTAQDRFMKVGTYLPSAVLISVTMMFGGLRCYVDAGWTSTATTTEKSMGSAFERRKRPVLEALGIMFATHVGGFGLYKWTMSGLDSRVFAIVLALMPPVYSLSRPSIRSQSSLPLLLKSFNLCFSSTVISVTTVLNFSLAACLAVLLGIPLSISGTSTRTTTRYLRYFAFVILGLGWTGAVDVVAQAFQDWEVLGVWFAPFVCIVYTPLVLQAGIACLLPS